MLGVLGVGAEPDRVRGALAIEPSTGDSCTLAKSKYVVPSGIDEYWRVSCEGFKKARWTAHLPQLPWVAKRKPVPL